MFPMGAKRMKGEPKAAGYGPSEAIDDINPPIVVHIGEFAAGCKRDSGGFDGHQLRTVLLDTLSLKRHRLWAEISVPHT